MELSLGMPRKERETTFGKDAESKDDQKNNGANAGQPWPVDIADPGNKDFHSNFLLFWQDIKCFLKRYFNEHFSIANL